MTDQPLKLVCPKLPCPICEEVAAGKVEAQTFPYGNNDDAVQLSVRIPVYRCTNCELEFTGDEAEVSRHEAVCDHLGVLPPRRIRELRLRHGLSRAEFAKLTRIGEASIARWESGNKIQSPGYDQYLRLLMDPNVFARLFEPHPTAPRPGKFRALRASERIVKDAAAFELRPKSLACTR